jgi:hypothetical protein
VLHWLRCTSHRGWTGREIHHRSAHGHFARGNINRGVCCSSHHTTHNTMERPPSILDSAPKQHGIFTILHSEMPEGVQNDVVEGVPVPEGEKVPEKVPSGDNATEDVAEESKPLPESQRTTEESSDTGGVPLPEKLPEHVEDDDGFALAANKRNKKKMNAVPQKDLVAHAKEGGLPPATRTWNWSEDTEQERIRIGSLVSL